MSEVVTLLRRFISLVSQKLAAFRYGVSKQQLRAKSVQVRNKTLIPTVAQLKFLPKVLAPTEKKIIKTALIAMFASIGFLIISFFFFTTQIAPAFGGEYREGLVGRPLYINPLLSQTNDVDSDLSRLIFNGLVRYDASYNIVGDLAESWTISEDLKSYTFKIRQGVTWHDGQEFSVNDVFFTYQLIKDKTFKSPLNISFEGVTAEISGENEITFTLTEPYAGFINLMTVGILPQHLWFDIPSANAALAKYNQKPVGTGPYMFKTLTKESNGSIISYEFVSNPNYHLKKPYISTLIFKFYQDSALAVDALLNKQVDGLGFLSKDKASEVKSRQATIHNIQITQFTSIFFNKSKNKLLGDAKVLNALTLATNKDAIIADVLNGQGTTLAGPILPGFPGYDSNLKDEYNPVKAAEILTADGWGMTKIRLNDDGTVYKAPAEPVEGAVEPEEIDVLAKKDQPLVITLTTVNSPDSVKVVNALKDQWEQIGIKVRLEIVQRDDLRSSILPNRAYEALVYGGIINYDADLFPYWHSSQREFPGVNLANYVNRKSDELIEGIRKEKDETKRAEMYQKLAGIIKEDQPALFLYTPTYSYPVSPKVHGIVIPRLNLPSDRFWNISDWYIKVDRSFF